MEIFEIRQKVYALGKKGQKAETVCQWSKKHNRYIGVRGVRPTIPSDARPAKGVSEAVKKALAALKAN